jgi:hypothetical protein
MSPIGFVLAVTLKLAYLNAFFWISCQKFCPFSLGRQKKRGREMEIVVVADCSSASPPVDLPTLEAYRTYFTW